jgi:acyl carrier protein
VRELADLAVLEPRDVVGAGFGASSRERVRGLVVGILAAKSAGTAFSDDATLAEIGIASVDMVTLLLSVEGEFDIEVPQHEITAEVFRSVSTIASLIQRLRPQAVAA